jgi:hypothetical protein
MDKRSIIMKGLGMGAVLGVVSGLLTAPAVVKADSRHYSGLSCVQRYNSSGTLSYKDGAALNLSTTDDLRVLCPLSAETYAGWDTDSGDTRVSVNDASETKGVDCWFRVYDGIGSVYSSYDASGTSETGTLWLDAFGEGGDPSSGAGTTAYFDCVIPGSSPTSRIFDYGVREDN